MPKAIDAMKRKHRRNPIVFILDILCMKWDGRTTFFGYICSFAFVFNVFFLYSWEKENGRDTTWLFCAPLLPLFGVDAIYRYFRNRYLDKHNLPGPWGTGTIDPD